MTATPAYDGDASEAARTTRESPSITRNTAA